MTHTRSSLHDRPDIGPASRPRPLHAQITRLCRPRMTAPVNTGLRHKADLGYSFNRSAQLRGLPWKGPIWRVELTTSSRSCSTYMNSPEADIARGASAY